MTSPNTPKKPRTPGRPTAASAQTDQREALLDAAKITFASRGFAASSLRQIAQQAHVTPALASYYFGDKTGLLSAVIEQRVAPLAGSVTGALQGPAPAIERLRAFVHEYTETAARNPWLPQLIVREVLTDQGVLRDTFLTKFGGGLGAMLRGTIQQAQAQGDLRRDLDPPHVAMSLMALCVFPFIATPLVSGALGVRVAVDSAPVLAAHHWSLFLAGVRASS
jgi:TetR/AcrR family transcriptional regulator